MKVELVACTNVLDKDGLGLGGADHVCNMAAKNCVSEEMPQTHHIEDTYFFWEDEDLKSLKHALSSGHESVIEHAVFSFAISGISRACSHQLVRHRIASFSQQSQRYVNMDNFEYVTPESISTKDDWTVMIDEEGEFEARISEEYQRLMGSIRNLYQTMLESGIPEEDARYILPNACTTNIVMTMNARSLRHFLKLRLCRKSQWEIRELAEKMLECVKGVSDVIFADVGPACEMDGKCPERKPCNKKKLQVAVEPKQAYKEDGIEDAIMDVKG